ncbi:MAG: ATP-binding cassette domain-containing protein, partial [Acetivibrionales bacterium]
MKSEILRMERVTLIEDGVTLINNLNLNMYSGEIMGLFSINANGQSALLDLICRNMPIHFGRIYFNEQLVNSHRHSSMSYNPVAMIEKKSWLVDSLTVSDNVFVLSKGFKNSIINPARLNRELKKLTNEIGIEIDGDTHIDSLSDFECCVIEILKAVMSGMRLIILQDISSFLYGKEISKLHDIMHFYTKKGISFLYVCNQYDEISRLCDCVAIMENGKIRSILRKQDMEGKRFDYPILGKRSLAEISKEETKGGTDSFKGINNQPVFIMKNVYQGSINGISLSVKNGECVVLFDSDDTFNEEIIEVFNGKAVQSGSIYVGEDPL